MIRRRVRPGLLAVVALCGLGASAQQSGVLRVGSEDDESFAEIIVDPVEVPAAGNPPDAGVHLLPERTRRHLGTEVTVRLGSRLPEELAERLFKAAFDPFEHADEHLSMRDSSPITSVNARASVHAVIVPPETCSVLREAFAAAAETDGLFDPTIALADALWSQPNAPESDEILRTCERVGHAKVEIRNTPFAVANPPCGVRFNTAGMRISLEPYARAWALDRAAQSLKEAGATSFLLRAGDLGVAFGASEEGAWEVPLPAGGRMTKLPITDRAFALVQRDGPKTIDPRTCRPVEGAELVVLADSTVAARVHSKTASLLAPERALASLTARGLTGVIAAGERLLFTSDLRPALDPPQQDAGFRRLF